MTYGIRNMRFGIKTELQFESLLSQLLDMLLPPLLSHSVVPDSLQPHGLSPPGSSVHGILQARILEWVAMPDLPSPGIEPWSPALGFPGSSVGKESACSAGDPGLIPGLGRSPGEGNGNPFQYSCLRIPWTEEAGGLQSMGLQQLDTTR